MFDAPFFFAGAGDELPPKSESEPKSIEPPLLGMAGLPLGRAALPWGFEGPGLLSFVSNGSALEDGDGLPNEGSVEVGLVGAFSIFLGADSSGAGVSGIALGAGVVSGTGGDCSADDAA